LLTLRVRLERNERFGIEIAHIDIIDSRRFSGTNQIGITLSSHDRKHVERKIFDDPDGAFAFAEIGRA
jgi:hypothetical protein